MALYTSPVTPAWISVAPGSGWANYGNGYAALAYRKWASSLVEIKAAVKSSASSTASGTPIFTLPSGCRLSESRSFAAICQNTSGSLSGVNLEVYPSGVITPYFTLATVNYVGFSINFFAEQ